MIGYGLGVQTLSYPYSFTVFSSVVAAPTTVNMFRKFSSHNFNKESLNADWAS
jgi:hypothetical protein